MKLPEATKKPCNECPWRRNSAPGWLGPMPADDWLAFVHSDEPIACHKTIVEDGEFYGTKQCAGAAQFRTNVFKSPRDPAVATADKRDDTEVFGSNADFRNHHEGANR